TSARQRIHRRGPRKSPLANLTAQHYRRSSRASLELARIGNRCAHIKHLSSHFGYRPGSAEKHKTNLLYAKQRSRLCLEMIAAHWPVVCIKVDVGPVGTVAVMRAGPKNQGNSGSVI